MVVTVWSARSKLEEGDGVAFPCCLPVPTGHIAVVAGGWLVVSCLDNDGSHSKNFFQCIETVTSMPT